VQSTPGPLPQVHEERRCALRKSAGVGSRGTPVPSLAQRFVALGITVWFMNQYFPMYGAGLLNNIGVVAS